MYTVYTPTWAANLNRFKFGAKSMFLFWKTRPTTVSERWVCGNVAGKAISQYWTVTLVIRYRNDYRYRCRQLSSGKTHNRNVFCSWCAARRLGARVKKTAGNGSYSEFSNDPRTVFVIHEQNFLFSKFVFSMTAAFPSGFYSFFNGSKGISLNVRI